MDDIVPFLIGALLYVGALVLFFVFVAPFLLALGTVGLALYLLYGYARTAAKVLVTFPSPTPASIVVPPTNPASVSGEPAYGQYFFGQALGDLSHVLTLARPNFVQAIHELAEQISDGLFDSDAVLYTWPLGVVAYVTLALGAIAGAAIVGVVALLHALTIFVAQIVARVVTRVLRFVDSAALQLKGITIKCPACHQRIAYPAYKCSNCGVKHLDIRPGRFGVIRRVCRCGERLPTLLILGTHRLEAFCPHHDDDVPLAEHVGTSPEMILPIAGATSAGKTRLMIALVHALETTSTDVGRTLTLADDETRRRWPELRDRLVSAVPLTGTLTSVPRAYQLYVEGPGSPRRLFHLYDVAGERFRSREAISELRYLAYARTFLFVLDPTAIQNRVASTATITRAQGPAQNPESALETLVAAALHSEARTTSCRLGVVVSKWDLIRSDVALGPGVPSSEAVGLWLDHSLGLGSLQRTAQTQFGEVQYFVSASIVDDERHPDPTVLNILEWVLRGKTS